MKKRLVRFLLTYLLRYILADKTSAGHAVALAEASRQNADNAFTRRGKVYRSIKEWSPTGTPAYLLNLGTELAQALDEMGRK